MKKILLTSLAVVLSLTATGQIHNEAQDGDLSDAFDNPSGPFTLEVGDNIITASQEGTPRDIDYFTVVLPPDLQLDQLILDGYTAEGTNNSAFLGIQEGVAFTTDAMSTTGEDLLGGITYGSGNLDTDMLPSIGQLGQGFTPPLPTGTYTIWLNQTGPISEASLRFVVSGTLSTETIDLNNDITVFPNPVSDVLTIRADSTQITKISIYSITGELVFTQDNPTAVSVKELSAGVYFGQIDSDQGSITKKIIKL